MTGPQTFRGVVTAAKRMPKTISVTVPRHRVHPVVGKVQKRRTRLLTHDPYNIADEGDQVLIQACPPVSAAKRHILVEIIKKAQTVSGVKQGVTKDTRHATLAEAKEEVLHHSHTDSHSQPHS